MRAGSVVAYITDYSTLKYFASVHILYSPLLVVLQWMRMSHHLAMRKAAKLAAYCKRCEKCSHCRAM